MTDLQGKTDDLATLSLLSEDVLNNELKTRYRNNTIYTYVGDILIIVNPYQDLGLYTQSNAQKYRGVLRADVPPHVFAIADAAYTGVNQSNKSQVCVVSGESGAGKTETTKHLVRHILSLANGGASGLQNKILQTSPILEAFGNAQTVMNENSSRFGKYMEIKFNHQAQVIGIGLNEYLLERPRVVRQAMNERGFHIFYYLLAGMDQAATDALRLGSSHRVFAYLSSSQRPVEASVAKKSWAQVQLAFHSVGFETEQRDEISALLAAILHLGNVEFHDTGMNDDSCAENDPAQLDLVGQLLLVDPALLRPALMTSVSVLRGETITKKLTTSQSTDNRDALAKALYGRLFTWLVKTASDLADQSGGSSTSSIGLLDIFGFENFAQNGFEQLCINIANERLQYFFNEHIFKSELNEYKSEGLSGQAVNISYVDNGPLLQTFTGNPLSVFTILNEEAKLRSSSSNSLLQKLKNHLGNAPSLKIGSDSFTVEHYAGQVTYSTTEMINKNRDELPEQIINAVAKSMCGVVRLSFLQNEDVGVSNRGVSHKKSRARGRKSTKRASKRGGRSTFRRAKKKGKQSVAAQFNNSLMLLVRRMQRAEPHFLRCIKPNTHAAASNYDPEYVLQQLRYTGVLETVRIRREGYSARLAFSDFLKRFGFLAFPYTSPPAAKSENCAKVLQTGHIKAQGYILGKSKVFLKYWALEDLSQNMKTFGAFAVKIQACVRGFIERTRYLAIQRVRMQQQTQAISFFDQLKASAKKLSQRLDDLCLQDGNRQPGKLGKVPTGPRQSFVLRKGLLGGGSMVAGKTPKLHEIGSRAHKAQLRKSRKHSQKWFEKHESKRLQRAARDHDGIYPPTWFHEMISREEAETRLASAEKGCYLVRVSETGPGYALSVKDVNLVRNYKITVEEDLTYTTPGAPRPFVTLQDLIDHYYVDLLSDDGLTLAAPLPRPKFIESNGIEYASVAFENGATILMAPTGDAFEIKNDVDMQGALNAIAVESRNQGDKVKVQLLGADYRIDEQTAKVIEAAQIKHFGRPLSTIEEAGLEYHESTVPTSPRYSNGNIPDIEVNVNEEQRDNSMWGWTTDNSGGAGYGGYSPQQRNVPSPKKRRSWFEGGLRWVTGERNH